MARRRMIGGGVGALLALGVAWLLFGRRGAAAPAVRASVPTTVTMTLADNVVFDLIGKGVVPNDATDVYVDPTVTGVVSLGGGAYLIPPSLATAQGAMSPMPLAPESAGGTTLKEGGSPSQVPGTWF